MALRTFVKVSKITNLSDARYCAGMGVDMLGFVVEESNECYVSPQTYAEIIGWLSGVEFVAEFTEANLQEINHILENYPAHAIQTENEEVLAQLLSNKENQEIEKLPIKILFRTDSIDTLREIAPKYGSVVDIFVLALDAYEMQIIKPLAEKYTILLENIDNLAEIEKFLNDTNVRGFVLKGGKEIVPGLKDFDNLAEILEGLEINEQ
jgi:phosphoribosylanthranilate isomerase